MGPSCSELGLCTLGGPCGLCLPGSALPWPSRPAWRSTCACACMHAAMWVTDLRAARRTHRCSWHASVQQRRGVPVTMPRTWRWHALLMNAWPTHRHVQMCGRPMSAARQKGGGATVTHLVSLSEFPAAPPGLALWPGQAARTRSQLSSSASNEGMCRAGFAFVPADPAGAVPAQVVVISFQTSPYASGAQVPSCL